MGEETSGATPENPERMFRILKFSRDLLEVLTVGDMTHDSQFGVSQF